MLRWPISAQCRAAEAVAALMQILITKAAEWLSLLRYQPRPGVQGGHAAGEAHAGAAAAGDGRGHGAR